MEKWKKKKKLWRSRLQRMGLSWDEVMNEPSQPKPCEPIVQKGSMSSSNAKQIDLSGSDAGTDKVKSVSPAISVPSTTPTESSKQESKSTPLPDVRPIPLLKYKCGDIPSLFYVPDWISKDQEKSLMKEILGAQKEQWVMLRKRSLLQYGGVPHSKGMEAESLPDWLQSLARGLYRDGIFPQHSPNHVLVNKYESGEGITLHQDGPLYTPLVAIVSLGSGCLFDFYKSPKHEKENPDDPLTQLYVQPRSLLLFCHDLYEQHFHRIRETTADTVVWSRLVNRHLLDRSAFPRLSSDPQVDSDVSQVGDDHKDSGGVFVCERKQRISLTIRLVEETQGFGQFKGLRNALLKRESLWHHEEEDQIS